MILTATLVLFGMLRDVAISKVNESYLSQLFTMNQFTKPF